MGFIKIHAFNHFVFKNFKKFPFHQSIENFDKNYFMYKKQLNFWIIMKQKFEIILNIYIL